MDLPQPFELFAIRYARHEGRKPQDNYIGRVDLHDAASDLDYYVWVARRTDQTYVIDTGFDEAAARKRGRELLMPVEKGLALVGVSAQAVRHVILTHLHYDHAGTLAAFPNARFHIQEVEVAYATGPNMGHRLLGDPFDVENIVQVVRQVYGGSVVFHRGDAVLVPGLTLHLIGGHTAGLQIVRVWTKRGWVVLASDATHLYGNIENEMPFPIVYNVGDMLDGYDRVRNLADSSDHIIPGHDPQVMHRYPAFSKAAAGWVVRLDVPPKKIGK